MPSAVKKILYIIAGSAALALGIIGVFVPVLPTTPFLLLTAFCYMRSSKRLYDWLIGHRVFGTYIYNYITYKAVLKRAKIISLVFLWGTLGVSMLLVDSWGVRAVLLVIGAAVSVHLLMLKTIAGDKMMAPPAPKKKAV